MSKELNKTKSFDDALRKTFEEVSVPLKDVKQDWEKEFDENCKFFILGIDENDKNIGTALIKKALKLQKSGREKWLQRAAEEEKEIGFLDLQPTQAPRNLKKENQENILNCGWS